MPISDARKRANLMSTINATRQKLHTANKRSDNIHNGFYTGFYLRRVGVSAILFH